MGKQFMNARKAGITKAKNKALGLTKPVLKRCTAKPPNRSGCIGRCSAYTPQSPGAIRSDSLIYMPSPGDLEPCMSCEFKHLRAMIDDHITDLEEELDHARKRITSGGGDENDVEAEIDEICDEYKNELHRMFKDFRKANIDSGINID